MTEPLVMTRICELRDLVRELVGDDLTDLQIRDLLWNATCFPFDGLNGQTMRNQIHELGKIRRQHRLLDSEQAVSYLLAWADERTSEAMNTIQRGGA